MDGKRSPADRQNLILRLNVAITAADDFVEKLRAEVDKGTDSAPMMVSAPADAPADQTTMMVDVPEISTDEQHSVAIKDIAAIKAGDLLDKQADTAAALLEEQADTAAALLVHQATALNVSIKELHAALTNLEHRTVLTEERASMSEERATLADRRADRKSSPVVFVLIVIVTMLGLFMVLAVRQVIIMGKLKTQQTEICALNADLHHPTPLCP